MRIYEYISIITVSQVVALILVWLGSQKKADVARYFASTFFLCASVAIIRPPCAKFAIAVFVGAALGEFATVGKFQRTSGSVIAYVTLAISTSMFFAALVARLLAL